MTRAHRVLAASLVLGGFAACLAYAQQTTIQAPPMELVLAGKSYTPPLRGVANIEILDPAHKRTAGKVITTIKVRNASDAPIARLKVDEPWYDKGGNVIMMGSGTVDGLLQPGQVAEVTFEVPFNSNMLSNNYQFSHANGTVKVEKVAKFPEPPPEANPSQQQ